MLFTSLIEICFAICRYCVEFEVIKASKACHKIPPYNQLTEGTYFNLEFIMIIEIYEKHTKIRKSEKINFLLTKASRCIGIAPICKSLNSLLLLFNIKFYKFSDKTDSKRE